MSIPANFSTDAHTLTQTKHATIRWVRSTTTTNTFTISFEPWYLTNLYNDNDWHASTWKWNLWRHQCFIPKISFSFPDNFNSKTIRWDFFREINWLHFMLKTIDRPLFRRKREWMQNFPNELRKKNSTIEYIETGWSVLKWNWFHVDFYVHCTVFFCSLTISWFTTSQRKWSTLKDSFLIISHWSDIFVVNCANYQL